MSADRRYSDEEVAEILDRATQSVPTPGSTVGPHSGMTLAELHQIADEVGIPKGDITRAAKAIDHPPVEQRSDRTFLGATIGVGRSVDLPRRLTGEEWNRLVVDLRMTFDAKGKLREEGAFRQWSNGNLQALLEPTAEGERLRMQTVKGSAMPYMGMGLAAMGIAVVGAAAGALFGFSVAELITPGLVGAGLFGYSRITLPAWARRRKEQMEAITARLRETIEE